MTAIVLDIDGTIIDQCGVIIPSIENALNYACQRTTIVLASGRSACGVSHVFKQLSKSGPFIALNGALIRDGKGRSKVLSPSFTDDNIRCIQEICSARNTEVDAVFGYTPNQWIAYGDGRIISHETNMTGDIPSVRLSIKELLLFPIIKLTIVCKKPALSSELYTQFSMNACFHVTPSNSRFLEITRAGVSKGRGVEHLRKLKRWNKLIAFGDGINDISVFQQSCYSYAMPWAERVVQRAAQCVINPPGHENLARLIIQIADNNSSVSNIKSPK
jgi:Cof subfamily protein (haloacid dehalogenase superfamily)